MPLVNLPQFTEMEAKIVGPLTFRQFLFILVATAFAAFVYLRFPRFISIPLAMVILGIGISFAFLKIEGVPFYNIFLGWFKSLFTPKIIFWGKGGKKTSLLIEKEIKKVEREKMGRKRESALKNLIIKVGTKK